MGNFDNESYTVELEAYNVHKMVSGNQPENFCILDSVPPIISIKLE